MLTVIPRLISLQSCCFYGKQTQQMELAHGSGARARWSRSLPTCSLVLQPRQLCYFLVSRKRREKVQLEHGEPHQRAIPERAQSLCTKHVHCFRHTNASLAQAGSGHQQILGTFQPQAPARRLSHVKSAISSIAPLQRSILLP